MTVNEAFRAVWQRLEAADIATARTDARLLVGFVLGGGAERVLAERDRQLSADEVDDLEALVRRRLAFEPMSLILGRKEFWSLEFKVTADTLTPRPDTETLIEAVLEHTREAPARVLDLGTGTGCILLALLSEWPQATGLGVDASAQALEVANENAHTLGLAGRARFVRADWTRADWAPALNGPFDVVVSNPPYIPAADIEGLAPDVRDFEPHAALAGGADGLDAYRAIVAGLEELLAPGGLIAFEVGIGQAVDVASLLAGAGYAHLETRVDLGGVARVVVARKELA